MMAQVALLPPVKHGKRLMQEPATTMGNQNDVVVENGAKMSLSTNVNATLVDPLADE